MKKNICYVTKQYIYFMTKYTAVYIMNNNEPISTLSILFKHQGYNCFTNKNIYNFIYTLSYRLSHM